MLPETDDTRAAPATLPDDAPGYDEANDAKATFSDVYTAPTPHAYLEAMGRNGYCIAEHARPYFTAAATLLAEANGPARPVQLLDLGCSYGVGSATVNHGCSFEEFRAFFAARAPRDYDECVAATRLWLQAVPAPQELRIVGVDTSVPAIRFATDAGLIAGGVSRDLERDDPSDDECAWMAGCNLLTSTGAIGYVTDATVRRVLRCLARDHAGPFGPVAVLTVLRMFSVEAVAQAFSAAGLAFVRVPGVRLRQRRFADAAERTHVLQLLAETGVDPDGWESTGWLWAELYVAAKPERLDDVLARLLEVRSAQQPDPAPGGAA